MKKVIIISFLISLFFLPGYAQQTDKSEEFSNSEYTEEADGYEKSDDFEDFDDFDSIFDDAEDLDEAVVDEEEKPETPIQVVASAFSSIVHFSGSFNAEVGLAFIHLPDGGVEENNIFNGFFSLNNTLNMMVNPTPTFVVRGSVDTGINNGFNISVSSLYFDYLLLNHVYISAGKKGISWGNIRLFNSGYYGCETHSGGLYSTGPKHADIFGDDGAALALDIKYPWSFGTLTFATTGNAASSIKVENFNYYGSLELSVLNTNFNLYAKRATKKPEPPRSDLVGLEIKRTILGFDTYVQGICRINNFKKLNTVSSYDYIVGTAGIYRLFDSFDPNIGFNIEYQHEYVPSSEIKHYDRLAFEGGLKRIGNKKNIKIGVMSHYTITEKHGFSGLNFTIANILPYADWTNKFAIGYGEKYIAPVFMLSTSISLALNY